MENREIKFRVICKVGTCFSKGDPAYYEKIITFYYTLDLETPFTIYDYLKDDGYYLLKIISVDMFTGVEDNHGKEVYGGDIIQTYGLLDDIKGTVMWDAAILTWYVHPPEWRENSGYSLYNCRMNMKKIGNIYENPELIQDKQIEDGKT